ncbi:YugN-like family protein [Paenibacillus sp. GD4]|uniref:YugN-like family protein n=1 Tax=Paenibacillus sp. GD4 TaxID=3068890 RepID=UPI002796D542|nr:YugN-like family protein [Paenibacillus sp. GD4]MDQ1910155.1 YugN-like family protein [Paenibacillus sp. GD4]
MIPINSSIENTQEPFDKIRNYLHSFEFVLGGNWDYEHGYFDRYLDEGHKVWLRIPFEVTHGRLEGDTDATDAVIRVGTPFVLKHVYNEGLDKEAQIRTYGALVDQFQEPVDKDAPVDDKWVQQAKDMLQEVERSWLH